MNARSWYFREFWHFDAPSDADLLSYAKALVCCMNGDGEIASAERDWLIGFMTLLGVPEAQIEELRSYDGKDDVTRFLSGTKATGRVIVYDAVTACSADGGAPSPGELATICRMAEHLGISQVEVGEIIALYKAEQEMIERRLHLLFPQGKPT
jgi:hypothetical protein